MIELKHSNIDQLKMKHLQTYSEDLFDIPHPPDHQCPNIDKLITIIRTIEKISGKAKRMDEDELLSAMDDINSDLWGFESELEDVRSACEGIRVWGQEWKDKCKKVLNSLDNAEDYM